MAGEAAAGPGLQAPGFEIDVVVDDEHRLGLDLEEPTRCGHGATRVVHERLGLEQREPQPIEPNLDELTGELRAPAAVEPPRELVHHHPADVVAVALVLPPGGSPPPDEQGECRGRLAPPKKPPGLAPRGALLPRGGRPPPCPPPPRPPPRPA